jgi:hypothetical protein
VSFHTFNLPEDGGVRLLVKNLCRGMPESVVREELESLIIRVQGVMKLRSGRRDQDPAKNRPPYPNFIVSLARGSEVSNVRSLTEICVLRVSVELYVAPKDHCSASATNALDTHSVTAHTRLAESRMAAPTSPVGAPPRAKSLNAVTAGETTRRTAGAVLCGKRRKRLLRCKIPSVHERASPQTNLPPQKISGPGLLPSRWTWPRGGFTSSEGGLLSRPPQLQSQIPLLSRSR